jgi:hypothetical protein
MKKRQEYFFLTEPTECTELSDTEKTLTLNPKNYEVDLCDLCVLCG